MLSKYNVIKTIDKTTWVYNTLTSAFIAISTDEWHQIIENADSIHSDNWLYQAGICTASHEEQLFKYKYISRSFQFRNDTLFLYIAPTMQCNFNCFYCFEKGNKNEGVMSEDIENNLITFLKLSGNKELSIVWFGGEPLLGFGRIVSICKKLRKSNIRYTSSIITNGSLLSEKVISRLELLNLDFIQISMDGIAKDQDRRRCFSNGEPTFDIIIRNVRNLILQTDIPISVQVTVDKSNANAYDDLKNYFASEFPCQLESRRLQIGKNYVRNRAGHDCHGTCYTNADMYEDEVRMLNSGHESFVNLPGLLKPCSYRCISCLAIDSAGRISKCIEHMGSELNYIGSLKTGKMSLSAMARTAFEDDPFDDEECINCNVFPICGGGCPIGRIKVKQGQLESCCSRHKDTLKDLLPILYKYKFRRNEKL